MELTRRAILSSAAMGPACIAAFGRRAWAEDQPQPQYVDVKTAYGRLRGMKSDGLATFKGIPYAGSVSGSNRFKAAPALKPWSGVRDAFEFGPPSVQPGQRRNEPAPSEDCLFLNVWTPAADGRKRPVMFYSHGGGFTTGSAGAPYQDGGNLARTWDVVVVATNHRLGLLGFLYLGELGGDEYATSGNQGLLDICNGLKWVRDNIEAFGGDPANVMIFGESGGGGKTSCLYAMPAAAPFFNKASIESGPGIRMMPRDAAAETTLMTLKELGVEKAQWRKLLEIPAGTLLQVQNTLGEPSRGGGPLTMAGGRKGMASNPRPGGFGPVVDGLVLPRHPFDPDAPEISKNKPLIVGSNRDETIFFFQQQRNTEVFNLTEASLKKRLAREFGGDGNMVFETYRKSRPEASPPDLYIAITTARMFGSGGIAMAESKYAQHAAPVYMYLFTHESDLIVPGTQHKVGAAHALEIPYKFYNVKHDGQDPPRDMMTVSSPEAVKTAHNMSEMWSTFARTGHPAAKGQPAWPPYTTERRSTMEIDTECRVVDDPYRLERTLWERLDT